LTYLIYARLGSFRLVSSRLANIRPVLYRYICIAISSFWQAHFLWGFVGAGGQ
jgi:hypothetical protein